MLLESNGIIWSRDAGKGAKDQIVYNIGESELISVCVATGKHIIFFINYKYLDWFQTKALLLYLETASHERENKKHGHSLLHAQVLLDETFV